MSSMCSAVVTGCAVLALACDGRARRSTTAQPSPVIHEPQPTPPPSPVPGSGAIKIGLGETRGHFAGAGLEYEFIANDRGTLTVRLDWPLVDSFLTLRIQGTDFGFSYPPIVWRGSVEPGEKITFLIGGGGTDEVYDEHFTLTLSLEG